MCKRRRLCTDYTAAWVISILVKRYKVILVFDRPEFVTIDYEKNNEMVFWCQMSESKPKSLKLRIYLRNRSSTSFGPIPRGGMVAWKYRFETIFVGKFHET